MESISDRFSRFPSQKAVAEVMMRYGLSVRDGNAYCGDVEIADSALARAAKVDRRVVRSTIERISEDKELFDYFSKLKPISLLSDVAPVIGCGVIEIIPVDAKIPGILAEVTQAIFNAGVSVRQAVVDDMAYGSPRLIIVLDGQLPAEYIPRLRACHGVSSVTLK